MWKRRPLTRVGDRLGQLVYEYCKSLNCKLREKEREREERERGERERGRERERRRESTLIILFTIRWQLHYVFTRQFSRVLTPGLSSRFFTGISRRRYVAYVYNGEIVSLIGNQRVGIFPPKSEILFVLSLALIWCQNLQDGSIPVGGDTWPSCTSDRRIITRMTRA